ncbi:uncharacterized protein BO72DRAFT_143578 [Aspergillus fijiensis CBS 313.89]|uniref:Uncharacterized protein n=1 Tax=Aspergillus fijiensis CBS 313.89 TaxID=1448319 RepID=A0A8G1RN37_9EURO|nr:uncharacterized protein BO72DRAFT_143578 [Aspergillus fijiensis CBS 313.89]RAK76239.1 hypothetical protein BO72DRAFT_143578 [Aspergillus fijiensis CBS 313.89]
MWKQSKNAKRKYSLSRCPCKSKPISNTDERIFFPVTAAGSILYKTNGIGLITTMGFIAGPGNPEMGMHKVLQAARDLELFRWPRDKNGDVIRRPGSAPAGDPRFPFMDLCTLTLMREGGESQNNSFNSSGTVSIHDRRCILVKGSIPRRRLFCLSLVPVCCLLAQSRLWLLLALSSQAPGRVLR